MNTFQESGKRIQSFSAVYVPQIDRLLSAGHQLRAVGAESQARAGAKSKSAPTAFERLSALLPTDVPELRCIIFSAGGQPVAIRAVFQKINRLVSFQGSDTLKRRAIIQVNPQRG